MVVVVVEDGEREVEDEEERVVEGGGDVIEELEERIVYGGLDGGCDGGSVDDDP
jgi:hypothetical protein